MKQRSIPLLLVLWLTAGCVTGGSVVGGSVGVGSTSGMGVVFSSYGDFLYNGPDAAFRNNRTGLQQLLDKEYNQAEATFRATLKTYPGNPDAVYYLGLALIHLDKRDQGFAALKSYQDSLRTRVTQDVHWWANYCEKRPEMTADSIQRTMNKARGEAFQREREEDWENRRGL
jgi:predicted Zn-dependent protease